MKKSALSILLCLLLCGLLAACGGPEGAASSGSVSGSASQPESAGSNVSDNTQGLSVRQAYAQVLDLLLNHNILPDGQHGDPVHAIGEKDSTFAIADVDGDGREELVVNYLDTSMAGMTGYVCEYLPDTGMMKMELIEFPDLTFYDNGVVLAGWSHNQGKAGEFWPYSAYVHQADADSYEYVGAADAWDKEFWPEDYPEDVDTSGTGRVYYLPEGPSLAESRIPEPVDASVYDRWRQELLGQAREITPDYLPLNEQNIRQITEQAD